MALQYDETRHGYPLCPIWSTCPAWYDPSLGPRRLGRDSVHVPACATSGAFAITRAGDLAFRCLNGVSGGSSDGAVWPPQPLGASPRLDEARCRVAVGHAQL